MSAQASPGASLVAPSADSLQLSRDDDVPDPGRRRVEDLDLVVEPRAGEVDVRRPRPAVDGDPAAGKPVSCPPLPLRQALLGGKSASEGVGAHTEERPLVARLHAGGQVTHYDVAVGRPPQLVEVPRLRAGPVDRLPERTDDAP